MAALSSSSICEVRTPVSAEMNRSHRNIVSRGQYNDLAHDMIRDDATENATEHIGGQSWIILLAQSALTTSQTTLDPILLEKSVALPLHRAHRLHATAWPSTTTQKYCGMVPCDRVPSAVTLCKLSCTNPSKVASFPRLQPPELPKSYLEQSSSSN